MAGDPGDGLRAAVELALDAAAEPVAAEQLPLLPAEDLAALPDDEMQRRRQLAAPRGPGRPKGSSNRKTLAMRDWILSRYRSPLEVLAETYSRPVADLALELGCSRIEAFDRQQRAAIELAPYLHGKAPVEVHLSGALPTLMMADPRLFLGQIDQDAPINLAAIEILENQGDSASVAEGVGQIVSDETSKHEQKQ